MELIIRIILMFILVHFLVVMSIMVLALLLARPEVPVLGREPNREALARSYAFMLRLPSRTVRSVVRLVNWMRPRSVH